MANAEPAKAVKQETQIPSPGPKSNTTEIQLYRATLRHAGNIGIEIPVTGVSQREILLMRAIHGDDAVVKIEEDGKTIVDDRDEIFKLARKYPHPLGASASRMRVEKLLNISLHGYEEWLTRQIDTEDEARSKSQSELNRAYNSNRQKEQAAALTDAIRAAATA